MARGVNKVILVGALGADPETRYTANGGAVANLSLATSESWKDRNSGQMQERTEWHRVVLFGKTAEIAQQYLRKGAKVYIEGKLRTNKWQDQQGNDRYTTEIVVDISGQMQMLDSRQSMDSGMGAGAGGFQQSAQPTGGYQPPQQPAPMAAPSAAPMSQPPQQPSQAVPQPAPSVAPQTPQPPASPQQQHGGAQQPQQPQPSGFDDFDDDIPF